MSLRLNNDTTAKPLVEKKGHTRDRFKNSVKGMHDCGVINSDHLT